MNENQKEITCFRCGKKLQPAETFFRYVGHTFHTDILRCPECGEVYIPESLVRGRMKEVEKELEDK
ncbi:MAG: hypothetical protein IJH47_07850 [Oscillospiraceae bacterium]|nr:hypothetical protein [Oscillospiraceae bacterium]